MAANGCNKEAVAAEPPKFFKFVINPQDHTLKIPTEFIRRYGHNLGDIVFLRVPTGALWKIELTHSENKIWMQKGWQEFKEHYSIDFGYFLVFKYNGKSQFDVFIFDITASEVEYPLDDNHGVGSEMEDTGSESDDYDDVLLEELSTRQKGRNQENRERSRTENRGDLFLEDSSPSYQSQGKSASGAKLEKASSNMVSKKKYCKRLDKKTCVAYQRAKSFKSDNPFYISILQPSYVDGRCMTISLPLSIVKGNLPGKHNKLKLRVPNGKTWPVSCTVSTLNAKLHSGWKEFVKGNRLKVGDACVFEVVKSKELVWNVIIFRC